MLSFYLPDDPIIAQPLSPEIEDKMVSFSRSIVGLSLTPVLVRTASNVKASIMTHRRTFYMGDSSGDFRP
jgi:hypothetical protein